MYCLFLAISEYLSDTNTSTYAVPDAVVPPFYHSNTLTGQMVLVPTQGSKFQLMGRSGSPPPLPPPPHPRALYSSAGATILQGCSGNSIYSLPVGVDLLWKGAADVVEIPRSSLRFIEKLGEGLFGEVSC